MSAQGWSQGEDRSGRSLHPLIQQGRGHGQVELGSVKVVSISHLDKTRPEEKRSPVSRKGKLTSEAMDGPEDEALEGRAGVT